MEGQRWCDFSYVKYKTGKFRDSKSRLEVARSGGGRGERELLFNHYRIPV
jgi:hypothetical protein